MRDGPDSHGPDSDGPERDGTTPLGVVLCGGASSRMGADKALLGAPGEPLAGVVARALRDGGCRSVVLVGGDEHRLRSIDAPWLPDAVAGEGPLGGIAAVVAAHPGTALVVCACDLPWIEGRDLRPLLSSLAAGAAVAVFDLDGVPQWSAAALSAEAAAAALDSFRSGERSLHAALGARTAGAGGDLRILRAERAAALRDVDRPEDLPRSWSSSRG